ncbi:MAG: hypothetical protein NZN45_00205 [Rhodovarius sp.]|nr:hypothetical protein [Rhodovarius sp.]
MTGLNGTYLYALTMIGGPGADTFQGHGQRVNVVSYFNSPAAIVVDLAAGTAQDGFGFTDTLLNVRQVYASSYNDTLLGSDFGDSFHLPAGGSHFLDGRGALDRGNEIRAATTSAVYLDLGTTPAAGGGFQGVLVKAGGTTDTFVRFTRGVGGAGNDTLLGTPGNDVLEGAQGHDLLIGRSGFDYAGYFAWNLGTEPAGGAVVNLTAGTATDPWGFTDTLVGIEHVFGSAFGDDLTGRDLGFWRRSYLQGLEGADTLRGAGSGWTAADYSGQNAPVSVDLLAGTGNDGRGFFDTLININSVRGSNGNDTLLGSNGPDWLTGGPGNDTLYGRVGSDRLFGDAGDDIFLGGPGDDVLEGGAGADTLSGGDGADRFVFALGDSPRSAPDVLQDFDPAWDSIVWRDPSPLLFWAGWVPGFFSALAPDSNPGADFPLPPPPPPPSDLAEVPEVMFLWAVRHATDGAWLVVDENGDGLISTNETTLRILTGGPIPDSVANGYLVGGGEAPTRHLHDALGSIVRGDGGSVPLKLANGSEISVPAHVVSLPSGTGRLIFMSALAPQNVYGTPGNDVFYGGGQPDLMAGGSGDDQYVVRHREAVIVERAGQGLDTAWYEASDARMFPHVEIGRLIGTADRLNGTSPDSAQGASGNDVMVANQGLASGSTLLGFGGDDELWGSPHADILDGGEGDDTLRGQGGADTMDGGPGNDQYVVMDLGARIVEWWGGGIDTAWVAVDGWTMSRHVEIGRLAAPGARTLYGSEDGEDLVANQLEGSALYGHGGNDVLWGSPFNDTLHGGAGNDILRGQGGSDTFVGGPGNDQFVVFLYFSQVIEEAGGGYDIVYFGGEFSFFIGDHVEEGRLFGQGSGLIGNDLANLLVGNSSGLASFLQGRGGDDILFGTAAGDTLWGGAGNDTIYCLGGADVILIDEANSGIDLVAGFEKGAARILFGSGSQVTSMADLALTIANGNTQVTFPGGVILVFGAELSAGDFLFGLG